MNITDGVSPSGSVCILYPGSFAITKEELLSLIKTEFGEIDKYSDLYARKKKLDSRLATAFKTLARRTREPFSYKETLSGAFIDIFR